MISKSYGDDTTSESFMTIQPNMVNTGEIEQVRKSSGYDYSLEEVKCAHEV